MFWLITHDEYPCQEGSESGLKHAALHRSQNHEGKDWTDHKKVRAIFDDCEDETDEDKKAAFVKAGVKELIVHAALRRNWCIRLSGQN